MILLHAPTSSYTNDHTQPVLWAPAIRFDWREHRYFFAVLMALFLQGFGLFYSICCIVKNPWEACGDIFALLDHCAIAHILTMQISSCIATVGVSSLM